MTKGRATLSNSCDKCLCTKATWKLTPKQTNVLACTLTINDLQYIGAETNTPERNFDSDSYIQSLAKEAEKN